MICSDIWHSKLLYIISWAVKRVKFETILKCHEWYLCQISRTNHAIVYTTTHRRFVIFTCRYFKLSWNTTALSQSNCRNFSRSSITGFIRRQNFDVSFGASLLWELYGIAFLTFTLPSQSSDRKVPIFCAVFDSRSPFRFASEPHGNNGDAWKKRRDETTELPHRIPDSIFLLHSHQSSIGVKSRWRPL